MLSSLLYDSLPYFLQAVSLAEPGARLPDSKSPALTALGSLVLEGPCVAFYKDSSDSNSGPQVCAKEKTKTSYPLSSPPASIFSVFNSCALRGRQKTYSVSLHAPGSTLFCAYVPYILANAEV